MKSRGHLPWCHVADDVIHHLRKEVYRIFFNIAGKSAVSSDDLVAGDLVTMLAGGFGGGAMSNTSQVRVDAQAAASTGQLESRRRNIYGRTCENAVLIVSQQPASACLRNR